MNCGDGGLGIKLGKSRSPNAFAKRHSAYAPMDCGPMMGYCPLQVICGSLVHVRVELQEASYHSENSLACETQNPNLGTATAAAATTTTTTKLVLAYDYPEDDDDDRGDK